MKPTKFSRVLHSFQDLKVLHENRPFSLPVCPPVSTNNKTDDTDPENEQKLFQEAMADVRPIPRQNYQKKKITMDWPALLTVNNDSDAAVIKQLSNLIEKGIGFVVAQTPEYIEGIGYNVKPDIATRLHHGDFAFDAHLDLHGFNVVRAQEVFDSFLKAALKTGKKTVLIVHGRGLSSPEEPVLKTKVKEWLTQGPWRKWVVAYSSARPCDGGAGATYVLLRERPYTKRLRKRRHQ